jgi:hypothetical protein
VQGIGQQDVVAFAERVLVLLDQGSFVATYKYAVLLALMDLCLEKTTKHGTAPETITTRELAEKVIELYWKHTLTFKGRTLRQNGGRQARILTDICEFRASLPDPSVTFNRATRDAALQYQRLVHKIEWTLILMPLPRLQVIGRQTEPLLYDIAWGLDIGRRRQAVSDYQKNPAAGTFDNRIALRPRVGEYLVVLNGLLRPLLHRSWAEMVARLNGLDESRLESFLFGVDRAQLAPLRPSLLDLQNGRCFYCSRGLGRTAAVDHFIPWSRYPDNGIQNLVAADPGCNTAKRDFLAAEEHVARWHERNWKREPQLVDIAERLRWENHGGDTLGVARGIYLRLPAGAQLWLKGSDFKPADPARLRAALG